MDPRTAFVRACNALALSALIAPAALAQSEPAGNTPETAIEIEVIGTIQGGEVSRESIRWTRSGWTASGSFDIFGQRKGSYEVEVSHGDPENRGVGGMQWTLDGGENNRYQAVLEGRTMSVFVNGSEEPRTAEVPEGDVFVYEDLVWGSFFDLGVRLTELEGSGELADGRVLQAVLGSISRALPVTVKARRALPQAVDGEQVPFHVFELNFAGAVDMLLVCDPRGVPVVLDIPSQFVHAYVKGYEDVKSSEKEPTSIIDAGSWRETLSQPDFEYEVRRNLRIPMRDGVELAADVFLPEGDGPFPTVLARTPYNRATESGLKGAYYARRGYAFVAQDVRGRFDSGGTFVPLFQEAADGSDTLDWIADQDWSNGDVGMVGASYVGLVQWLAARTGNPHLKCIVPQVSPPDPHENFPYEGGAMILGAAWWAKVLDSVNEGQGLQTGADWESVLGTLPATDLDKALGVEHQEWLDEWMLHPPHEVEYWEPGSYQDQFDRMTVPAMHITGWWDGDQPGALQNFVGMSERAKTELARDGQYLIVGPWTHFFNSSRSMGDVDFGDEAVVDLDSRIVRFFDRYLKGVENGIEDEPHVMTFTMGANQWVGQDSWPLAGTEFVELYLGADQDAKVLERAGTLGLEPGIGDRSEVQYDYDPSDLPEFDADFEDLSGAQVVEDQSSLEDREDELEFLSPPLGADCDLVGPIEVDLFVQSSAEDTDFVVVLYRVTPDGGQYVLRSGIQRLRYAADPRKDQPVPPEQVAKVTIDCWATGQRLEAGERLLLRVSSHGWPGVIRNFNTLQNPATVTDGVVATNTILLDPDHPSCVRLPVVPSEGAPGLKFE